MVDFIVILLSAYYFSRFSYYNICISNTTDKSSILVLTIFNYLAIYKNTGVCILNIKQN